MLGLLGIVMGFVALYIPLLLWPRDVLPLSAREFAEQYPGKRWLPPLQLGLYILWILLYLILVFPVLIEVGDRHLYLVSYAICGGWSAIQSIIEITTKVSSRNLFGKGADRTTTIYLVDDSVRRLGWIRLGFILFWGLVPSGIVSLVL